MFFIMMFYPPRDETDTYLLLIFSPRPEIICSVPRPSRPSCYSISGHNIISDSLKQKDIEGLNTRG